MLGQTDHLPQHLLLYFFYNKKDVFCIQEHFPDHIVERNAITRL